MSKQNEVLNHWIASADAFSMPPQEFYEAVEKRLEEIKVPGLQVAREDFAEGGWLSGKRTYLCMMRERLAFQICAAPFGSRFFFSCRTTYIPASIKIWQILVLAGFFFIMFFIFSHFLSLLFAGIAVAGLLVAMSAMLRNAVALGLSDVDVMLLKSPVVGAIYERVFRKDTYYRQDTRLMYLDTVPNLVQKLADEATGAKGIKLVRQYRISPLLGDLYKSLPSEEKAKPEK